MRSFPITSFVRLSPSLHRLPILTARQECKGAWVTLRYWMPLFTRYPNENSLGESDMQRSCPQPRMKLLACESGNLGRRSSAQRRLSTSGFSALSVIQHFHWRVTHTRFWLSRSLYDTCPMNGM